MLNVATKAATLVRQIRFTQERYRHIKKHTNVYKNIQITQKEKKYYGKRTNSIEKEQVEIDVDNKEIESIARKERTRNSVIAQDRSWPQVVLWQKMHMSSRTPQCLLGSILSFSRNRGSKVPKC